MTCCEKMDKNCLVLLFLKGETMLIKTDPVKLERAGVKNAKRT